MVFNSLVFLAFLGIVLLLYYRLGQNWRLILALEELLAKGKRLAALGAASWP